MKKYIFPVLILTFLLSSCGDPAAEVTPTPTPTLTGETEPSAAPTEPAAADDTRYFFADGIFLGAWSGGLWRSPETEPFTVGEIFDRDYYDFWGEPLNSARFYAGEGPGSFENGVAVGEVLESFGVMEGNDFIMKLPGKVTGEAAALTVPNYGFYVWFEGQSHQFVSNVPFESPSMHDGAPRLPDDEAARVLARAGIHCDLSRMNRTAWTCDMDGDGQEETLELIQPPRDRGGYSLLEPGDQCFYAFLLGDGEDVSLMASRAIDYTDDVTAHFDAADVQCRDLDGDGVCELIFREGCWEWGCYEAHTRMDGQWILALRANYGM